MVVLAEAVRGSLSFGHVGDASPTPFSMPAGAPRPFVISFPSVDWLNPAKVGTLHLEPSLDRSVDGGVTWVLMVAAAGGPGNVPGKTGVVTEAWVSVAWDGQAMLVRGSVAVNVPFSYGVTVT